MVRGVSVRVAVMFLALALPAAAADISGLGWGEFMVGDAGSARAAAIETSNGNRSLGVTMTIEDFSANAEGEKTEAAATFSGGFLVTQPAKLQLTKIHATVSGVIIKTAGSTARLDLVFGPAKSQVVWTESETKSERFTRDIDMIVPDGRLPSPFAVSAVATVAKPGKEGAALVSLDKITIDLSEALVGELAPQDSKKPAPPVATPALVASKN